MKPSTRTLALLTPVFILLAHYVAVLPHEFSHSFMAWGLGRKADPMNITWGHGSLRDILLLSGVDENVDYDTVFSRGPAWYGALIAFVGPGVVNGGLYLLSLAWLGSAWFKARPLIFYFVFWFNFMNIANIFDYIPIRVFSPRDDVANFVRGLNMSPWFVYAIGGYLIAIIIVDFLRRGLPRAYAVLDIKSTAARAGLMAISVAILFCYFSQPGFYAGNAVSLLITATSWLVVPGLLFICWPSRGWVKEQVRRQAHGG